MSFSPDSAAAWAAEQMRQKTGVQNVEMRSPRSFLVSRREYPPYVAGILATADVTAAHVGEVLAMDGYTEILANVPADGIWRGDAIQAAKAANVAFGGMKDLMSVIARENVRGHVRNEFDFIDRMLRQHGRIAVVEREADRLYRLKRHGLADLTFVALKHYELTGDHIRTARDRYGPFDLVFLNDPNGKPTPSAHSAAEALGVPIASAKELLTRIGKP